MKKDLDIYTGKLVYKSIEFTFVFNGYKLRLIPPVDKEQEIQHHWLMEEIEKGVYIPRRPLKLEEPFLIGYCNEDGNTIIFIINENSDIGHYNSVLCVGVDAYIVSKSKNPIINQISFMCPEINYIHSIGRSFSYTYDSNLIENGVVTIKTNDYNSTSTKAETFEVEGKKIEVSFGATRAIGNGSSESPLKLNSFMVFSFEPSVDYYFIYFLWRIAKQLIQYLCYRKNVYFSSVTLSTSYGNSKQLSFGEFHELSDSRCEDEELEVLNKGRYIKQEYISGAIGKILQSIVDNSLYLRHVPRTYRDGLHIDAAKFVMITAAFEWEFRKLYPEGIKKNNKKLIAEKKAGILMEKLIDNNTGEVKTILKYLKKMIGNEPLSSKLIYVGKELGSIIDVFGMPLYSYNNEKLSYSEMGVRLAAQRNDFAHGNLDKDFNGIALLDVVYLEYILYAMQLKCYGISNDNIQRAINDLFQRHVVLQNHD